MAIALLEAVNNFITYIFTVDLLMPLINRCNKLENIYLDPGQFDISFNANDAMKFNAARLQ